MRVRFSRTMTSLSEWFRFDAPDPINLYPFEARCIAAGWNPEKYPALMELGHATVDFLLGKTTVVSRQVRGGEVTLYFPERWLSVRQKIGLMQALCDLHEDYPLKKVNIITGEPIIISDFVDTMVRLMDDHDDNIGYFGKENTP